VNNVVGAAIILTVAGLVCWPQISLKTVVLEGEKLTIKGYWRTCTVECKEIVSLHTFWPLGLKLLVTYVPIVTFRVSRRTPLGRTFRFQARVTMEGSGSRHPDVRLLRELAGMEKSK
jgi:hypothetical protein